MAPVRADAPPASNDGAADSEDAEAAVAATLAGEQESYRRYQAAEMELLEVLEVDNVDDATRKRRMMRVFDRFRTQRRIRDKAGLEPSFAVAVGAVVPGDEERAGARGAQDRDEPARAGRGDEELGVLPGRVRARMERAQAERGARARRDADHRRPQERDRGAAEPGQGAGRDLGGVAREGRKGFNATLTSTGSLSDERPIYHGGSPSKESIHIIGSLNSPSKMEALKKQSGTFTTTATATSSHHPVLNFDEWKHANRVWSPAAIAPRSATPSLESLHAFERKQEIALRERPESPAKRDGEGHRCGGRATAAVAVLPLSPSPTRKSRKPQTAVGFMRATTSSGGSRSQASSLPHV